MPKLKYCTIMSFVFLTACTTKFVGQSHPLYKEHGCPAKHTKCTETLGDLSLNYTLSRKENNQIEITGTAVWTNSSSTVYEDMTNTQIYIALIKGDTVVQSGFAYIRGKEDTPLPFSIEIEGDVDFDHSLFISYSGRIREKY